ncbi:MAG: translocation/assembly module TamB domain-containing protein [Salinibacter sp.]
MADSRPRSYARLAGQVIRGLLYVCLAGVVLFFALTRTEVGRDRVRRQLQAAFNEQFVGSLHIGSLEGTLLNTLHASDVRLRGADGRLVATIDSVASEPQWRHLFTGELSVEALTVIGPHLSLHRRADGTWNLERALQREVPPSGERPLDLSLTDLEIRNGRVTTTRAGTAPSIVEDRWLFDYTRSVLDSLHAQASLRWTESTRRIDLENLQFRLPGQDLTLRTAQVELARARGRWQLGRLSVGLGNTTLDVEGSLVPAPDDSIASAAELRVTESRLDHDQLRRIVPRLPLRGVMTVEGRFRGAPGRLAVNELRLSHERSTLRIEGTASGGPDSLDVDAQLLPSEVRPSDVRAVWPDAPLGGMTAFGPVALRASLNGWVDWTAPPRPSFDLESTLTAQGGPGAVRGSLAVRRTSGGPLRYEGGGQVDSLDLAPLTGRPALRSRLFGRLDLQGQGASLSAARGELSVTLAAGRIGARRFSGVDLRVTAAPNRADGTLTLRQYTGGTLQMNGTLNTEGPTPRYALDASVDAFNLSALHPPLPSSRLNATLALDGRGRPWDDIVGTAQISVDSSRLRGGAQLLPPHEATLRLTAPTSDEARVRLTGTIASGRIEGRPLRPVVRRAARRWTRALRQSIRREAARAVRTGVDTTSTAVPSPSRLQAVAAGDAPAELRGALTIHRMDLLRTWWPSAPSQGNGFRTTARLRLGPDTLRASGRMSAPRLRVGSRRADSLTATYEVLAPYRPDLLSGTVLSATAQTDTLDLGRQTLVGPSVELAMSRRTGTLRARTTQYGRTGPYRLGADVTLERGLHIRLTDLYAGVGENAWAIDRPGAVSVYRDALVVNTLDLTSPHPAPNTEQHIRLHGAVSAWASDTLYAETSDVLLYPVGELAALPRPLGGTLNGTVALTGGWSRPQVQSTLQVRRLSFDRRLLGDLRVRTRLTPNRPDLLVDAVLTPGPSSLAAVEGPNLVPEGPRSVEENQLSVEGRVRLPGWGETPSAQTDQLDLSVDVQRADLFFFKYIFDQNLAQARGYTTGDIHVGGRFRRPIFDAELTIENGRFTLPQFGLDYTASGPVRVDRKGIHTPGLSVTDNGGSATIQGSVLFNDYRYFSFDLSAQLDELTIIDVANARDLAFYGSIRASGPASLTGPLSNATLRSERARTTPESELYIPVSEGSVDSGTGFIVFADSTGQIPDLRDLTRRDNIFSDRPAGEPTFLEGLEIDINVLAPEESTVNLVFDPVVGDVVTAVGSGRVQLQREEGEFFVYGSFNVSGGTYLFTAGEVFVRRFTINGGTITWDGPPTNAQLDIEAEYRTRASRAGLPGYDGSGGRIPVRVLLDIGGRVETPRVDLSLAQVRDKRNSLVGSQTLDAILNQADRTTEYATSVLLTNTFLLTTESFTQGQTTGADGSTSGSLSTAGNRLAFNSVSQLVASQLNRYLGAALPNVDLNFGLQGENANDLDLIYGVALRLLNERLVIRGEGVYTGDNPDSRQAQGPQGEFVVEVRLSNRVSVEAFYRRTGDDLTLGQTLTSSTGAGVSYQTEFPTWRQLLGRVFGWLIPGLRLPDSPPDDSASAPDPVVQTDADSTVAGGARPDR